MRQVSFTLISIFTFLAFITAEGASAQGVSGDGIRERIEERQGLMRNIQSAQKRIVIERVDERIMELNKNLTDHYSRILIKLEEQLQRIVLRSGQVAADKGISDALVRAAAAKAREAIGAARNETNLQSAKLYEVNFTDEESAISGLREARRRLRDDLATVRERVRLAHRATIEALAALKQLSD